MSSISDPVLGGIANLLGLRGVSPPPISQMRYFNINPKMLCSNLIFSLSKYTCYTLLTRAESCHPVTSMRTHQMCSMGSLDWNKQKIIVIKLSHSLKMLFYYKKFNSDAFLLFLGNVKSAQRSMESVSEIRE